MVSEQRSWQGRLTSSWRRPLLWIALAAVFGMLPAKNASAEELTAIPLKRSLELYEPVVLEVRYHARRELTREATGKRCIACPRRLVAELIQANRVVADSFLTGTGFAVVSSDEYDAITTVWGCFGKELTGKNDSEFWFWDKPGEYQLVVRDSNGGARSNIVAVAITPPANHEAAEAFASLGMEGLALVHLRAPSSDAITALRTQFPNSSYGALADAALVLRATRPDSREKGVQNSHLLAQRMSRWTGLLHEAPPFRLVYLQRLGALQESEGLGNEAQRTVEMNQAATDDPYYLRPTRNRMRRSTSP